MLEFYKMDPTLLRPTNLIDGYLSAVWTERFQGWGDFELTIYSTPENRRLLSPGTIIGMNQSMRLMIIETVDDKNESDGSRLYTVKGRSLEAILLDRVAAAALTNTTTTPNWSLTGTPGNIIREIFTSICIEGNLSLDDIIPNATVDTVYPTDIDLEPSDIVTIEFAPTTVYDAIVDICRMYGLGFYLIGGWGSNALYFQVYAGSDRTTSQTDLESIVFSRQLGNLQDTTKLDTIEGQKNVAYVFSPAGFETVVADGADPDATGFKRRVLMVDASDITVDNPDVSAALIKRGKEELFKHRQFTAFDGEVDSTSFFYATQYFLGDYVEFRDDGGGVNIMRVTEHIYSSDATGVRTYPTLTAYLYVGPDTWLGWDPLEVWEDLGEFVYWEDV